MWGHLQPSCSLWSSLVAQKAHTLSIAHDLILVREFTRGYAMIVVMCVLVYVAVYLPS
jgi:hypothetical protein